MMQVETQVKTITDAQMGLVAAKGGELGASWIILDRYFSDFTQSSLNCSLSDSYVQLLFNSFVYEKLKSIITQHPFAFWHVESQFHTIQLVKPALHKPIKLHCLCESLPSISEATINGFGQVIEVIPYTYKMKVGRSMNG